MKKPFIYVDMDQVLVDFLKGFKELTGRNLDNPSETKKKGKEAISNSPDYWENLPKMSDCDDLWNHIKKHDPKILTAKPAWDDTAPEGKWEWIQNNCPVPKKDFYCVPREEKQIFAKVNGRVNILIDDYDKNCKEWEEKGGIAIHHKTAKETIRKLKSLGL